MIQMAFWHDENVAVGTLATIAQDIERAGIKPPATLVVGRWSGSGNASARKPAGAQAPGRRELGSSRRPARPAHPSPCRAWERKRFALEQRHLRPDRSLQRMAPRGPGGAGARCLGPARCVGRPREPGAHRGSAGTYRNLDMASRYLCSDAPQSLRPALLPSTPGSRPLARAGGTPHGMPGLPSAGYRFGQDLVQEATCETLARFTRRRSPASWTWGPETLSPFGLGRDRRMQRPSRRAGLIVLLTQPLRGPRLKPDIPC